MDKIESYPATAKFPLMHHVFVNSQMPVQYMNGDVSKKEHVEEEENDKAVQTMDTSDHFSEATADGEESEEEDEDSDAGSVTSSGSNTSQRKKRSGLHSKLLQKKTNKKRTKRRKRQQTTPNYKPGDVVPVEVIHTASTVEVVWQVRSIEVLNGSKIVAT